MFAPQTYQARREALASHIGRGLILLQGNVEVGMNYADNIYPFRQDSTFLYYFGLDLPGLSGIIDTETGAGILFGDDLTMDMIVWTGPMPSLQELGAQVGVTDIRSTQALPTMLAEAWSKGAEIHYLPPYRHRNTAVIHEALNLPLAEVKQQASQRLVLAVMNQRSYKSAEELEQLDEACNRTGAMHLAAMRSAKPGMLESEVMSQVYRTALEQSGKHPSFPIILTVHGETLHNHHYHNTLQSGQLLLCDAGGQSAMNYAGDMTRTFPVDATFTQQQRDVYEIALAANVEAANLLKPGVTYKSIHLEAARIITRGLKGLGLMKGDVDAAVEAGAHALFFPHGLGHMMGLDVHDMEDLGETLLGYDEETIRSTQFGLKSLRLGKKLETGFVLTVEPGIYFIPALIDNWHKQGLNADFINFEALEAYKSFGGIRIEDDYVITESGANLLGKPVPKTVADIESIRQEALA
ncbi:aminopeptidase P family protein [Pontibacter sp. G13]|uniref:aminopeptidase P family protein n=1 Tax=Pontibacter sp. G13 TaxID=3074898 RepID=UPI00288C2ACA|nr:aminopeptidase P family protein [Pontibacter sp. G13]WNJ17025.1 aminopeptidase P family protein [Pontibacter sp. G13]